MADVWLTITPDPTAPDWGAAHLVCESITTGLLFSRDLCVASDVTVACDCARSLSLEPTGPVQHVPTLDSYASRTFIAFRAEAFQGIIERDAEGALHFIGRAVHVTVVEPPEAADASR